MAPVKFDDISKVATTILNDDYHVSGWQLKTKQGTSYHGTSVSSQVDLFADAKCSTPAKLTFAMPKPFGCSWFAISKLEMDKAGKFKLEASKDNLYKGFKVELKSDLNDLDKVQVCKTYTGFQDTLLKWEGKLTNPQDFTCEATREMGKATAGIKFTGAVAKGGLPDFGVRFLSGPFFASLMATKNVGTFDAAVSYKATPEISVAAAANATQKGGLSSASVGVVCKGLYKAKVAMDGTVSVCCKHTVAKGLSLMGGFKYSSKGLTYGCQVSLS